MFGGAATGNRCAGFIAASESFPDTSGGVFRGHALELRMGREETLALRQSHGMRGHGAEALERRAGAADEMVLDGQDGFRDDGELAFEQEIVNAHDRSGEGIFDGREQRVSEVILDGAESGIERCTWNSGDAFAKKLDGGGLAEGAGFALKGHAHGRAIECGHKHGLSCNKRCKTRREDCTRWEAEMVVAVPA